MQTGRFWKGRSECPAAAGPGSKQWKQGLGCSCLFLGHRPSDGRILRVTVWDPLVGYVLEELGELGREAFSGVPSSSCILKWARKKVHNESIQGLWQDVQGVRKGKREDCNQGHLDLSAYCPSPHQVGGLRRGSGPTTRCWLWAQGNPSLGRVSFRCWERAGAGPQLEGGKTCSSLKLETDFPLWSRSFTGAL